MLDDGDGVRRHTVNLLRVFARHFVAPAPTDEQIRQAMWDNEARKEDAQITRCDRCGEWSWRYPVCRGCRTSHQRRYRRTA